MKPPVFVLGSPRSGTTLLYHMLLSAGGFAVYRAESNVFNLLVPRFGDLSIPKNKKKLMQAWLGSKLFRVSGLNAESIERKILAECHNGGDFLRIVMEEVARDQHVDRWADCTPDHLLYVPEIKKLFPHSFFIHVIRDGRDVALSLDKLGWIRPFPGQKKDSRLVAGLYWEWIVRKGRDYGKEIAPDYLEVRFEELVSEPRPALARLSEFIQHDLNYDRIQQVAIGSVRKPNTSFEPDTKSGFNPIGRWKGGLEDRELAQLECLIGSLLEELHYPLAAPAGFEGRSKLGAMRALYLSYFDSKLWLKKHTPLGRYFMDDDLSWL